jgi:hypothetical protein
MVIGRWAGAIRIGDEARRGHDGRLPRRSGGSAEPGQQGRAEQARIPGAALRVQDLELRPVARRPVAIAGNRGLAALAHDVPPEPDPACPGELQPEPARLLDGRGQPPAERVRLQDDEQRPGTPRERREPPQPVPHPRARDRRVPPVRQVHDEQVHGPGGEQRGGQRERLLEIDRREHDEPFRAHAAGDGLHGIEGPRQVQPRDDRATCLRLCHRPQRDRRLA